MSSQVRGPARALLVIQQQVLADIVGLALGHGKYTTRLAPTPEDATTAIVSWQPHLVVLDLDTAGHIVERWSGATQAAERPAMIALTSRDDLKVRVSAFERGVDDILTVPFAPEELVARIHAVMRRTYRAAVVFAPTLRLGDLEIDIFNRHVRLGEAELRLTWLEQNLLYLLAANADRLLSRDEILDHVWGPNYIAASNVVDRHIRNLRVKLQHYSRRGLHIATVYGRGYQFVQEPRTASVARNRRMTKLHDLE